MIWNKIALNAQLKLIVKCQKTLKNLLFWTWRIYFIFSTHFTSCRRKDSLKQNNVSTLKMNLSTLLFWLPQIEVSLLLRWGILNIIITCLYFISLKECKLCNTWNIIEYLFHLIGYQECMYGIFDRHKYYVYRKLGVYYSNRILQFAQ